MHIKLSGLIAVFGGVYLTLMAHRVVPRKPKDPEKMELWHRKFGKMSKVLGPLLVGFGLLEFFGVLTSYSNVQTARMTMHRVQAGTPDESGWVTAESTYGKFSVKLPVPFNDFTVEDTNSSSLVRKAEMVGCTNSVGIKFTASRIFYRSSGTAAKMFEKQKLGGGLPGAIVTSGQVNGYESHDITFGEKSALARQRTILVGDEIYVLIVEWRAGQETSANSLVPIFFDSLIFPK